MGVVVSLACVSAVAAPAWGVNLTLVSESQPWPGVTWRHYTTTSPTTHTWVSLVDLCAESVHVAATKALSTTDDEPAAASSGCAGARATPLVWIALLLLAVTRLTCPHTERGAT